MARQYRLLESSATERGSLRQQYCSAADEAKQLRAKLEETQQMLKVGGRRGGERTGGAGGASLDGGGGRVGVLYLLIRLI